MFIRVTQWEISPENTEAAKAVVTEKVLPRAKQIPGLIEFIDALDDDGKGLAIAVYEDKAAAEAAVPTVKEIWAEVADMLTSGPEVKAYENVIVREILR
jgi:quinol monooxygenase YgiN